MRRFGEIPVAQSVVAAYQFVGDDSFGILDRGGLRTDSAGDRPDLKQFKVGDFSFRRFDRIHSELDLDLAHQLVTAYRHDLRESLG